MKITTNIINKIAQSKIEIDLGCQIILNEPTYNFQEVFCELRNCIFNSIPDKTNYYSETYKNAINSIPLKPTITTVVILKSFSTKIALNKLEKLPISEHEKIIKALLWIFKQTDTERRNTECEKGCGHEWHNIE